MAKVYRREDRGGAWYVTFRRNGRRYREYVGPVTMPKEDAEDIFAKRRNEIREEEVFGPSPEAKPKISFASFADDYLKTDSPKKKSKARDRSVVEMLKVQWKGLNIEQITTKMIEDYKAKREICREASTVAREIQIVKHLFKKAHQWKKLDSNPAATVEKPKVNNERVSYLEPDQMARLMSKLPAWLAPVVSFAHFTGARREEIIRLRWNDLDFKRGQITFRETKNGETGRVEMNNTITALLKSLPTPVDRSQRVFPLGQDCDCSLKASDGRPDKSCATCKGTGEIKAAVWMRIRRAWADACKSAKVSGFHFHDLRHQAATDLLTMGATLNDVRDFLRHKSMSMTLRYAHLVENRRKDTACLLDKMDTKTATRTTTG